MIKNHELGGYFAYNSLKGINIFCTFVNWNSIQTKTLNKRNKI